jgi:hypothetical protein
VFRVELNANMDVHSDTLDNSEIEAVFSIWLNRSDEVDVACITCLGSNSVSVFDGELRRMQGVKFIDDH